MASVGREPAGERDMHIPTAITAAESHAGPVDYTRQIQNTITAPHRAGQPQGQTPGSAKPQIENTITKAGPNK